MKHYPNTSQNKQLDPNRNILPELQEAVALKLKKKIASEWNAKRTQKQKDDDIFYTADDVTEATISDMVQFSNAKNAAIKAQAYRVSKRISVAEKFNTVTLVCKQTGIAARLDIPRIPGFYMEYENPLASLENCRELVRRGYGYLSQLDTSILSGILLILADDYNLFSFGPFESGASKNAIIRSCGKDEILKAILFIESRIHSENYSIVPRLSFQKDMDTKQGEMEARLNNWMRIVLKAIEEPALVFQAPAVVPLRTRISEEKKRTAEVQKQARKAVLSSKKSIAEARDSVKSLYKDNLIPIKMRNLLLAILEPTLFGTLDSATRSKIALKLSTLPTESRITALIKLFERDAEAIALEQDEDFTLTVEQKQIPLKTAFDLQNSKEVMEKQRAAFRAHKLLTRTIQNLRNPVPYNAQLLLTVDPGVPIAHVTIDSHWPALPTMSEELKEAFLKVHFFIGTKPAPIVEEKQEAEVAMVEIGDGLEAPALLWNSMSLVKQVLYKKKLLASKGK